MVKNWSIFTTRVHRRETHKSNKLFVFQFSDRCSIPILLLHIYMIFFHLLVDMAGLLAGKSDWSYYTQFAFSNIGTFSKLGSFLEPELHFLTLERKSELMKSIFFNNRIGLVIVVVHWFRPSSGIWALIFFDDQARSTLFDLCLDWSFYFFFFLCCNLENIHFKVYIQTIRFVSYEKNPSI